MKYRYLILLAYLYHIYCFILFFYLFQYIGNDNNTNLPTYITTNIQIYNIFEK